MPKVLLVEDDEFKQRRICEAVLNGVPNAQIITARSVNSGMSEVERSMPDVVLLDMSLTTFDLSPEETGGRPQNFGGLEILRQMERKRIFVPTIIITQYERFQKGSEEVGLANLFEDIRREHPHLLFGMVYYRSSQGAWKSNLRRMIISALRGRRSK